MNDLLRDWERRELFTIMRVYEVNGEKRRVLWVHKRMMQYDNGEISSIPIMCSNYAFIGWLLTNKLKI